VTRNLIETVMGAVVLAVAGLFIYFAYTTSQIRPVSGYQISAAFFKVGGLSTGSDVRISGVKVGTVLDRHLDPKTYDAIVTMTIANDIKLPEDTVAAIASESPLGGKYVRLEPGTAHAYLAPGGRIKETRSFKSLEDQVGEIIFLATGKSGGPRPPSRLPEAPLGARPDLGCPGLCPPCPLRRRPGIAGGRPSGPAQR
jgi:phospholipid/cholesterol/gamma-HCH transport system substrate-binding protein